MKVLADIDVANFQVRAYYTLGKKIVFPTEEVSRVVAFETMDVQQFNRELASRKNIFSILSKKEQKKLERIAEPITTSGMRGTAQVEVDEKQLRELMNHE